jgi:AcrR family transcriptional regulator
MNENSPDKTETQPPVAPGKPPAARLRDRLREQTQAAILEAAEQVLAEEGLAQARIDAIAAQAGVSVGTLYNYFGDRDGIVRAVMAHNTALVLSAFEAVVEQPSASFAGDLHRLFEVFAVHCRTHGRFIAVVMNANPADRVCPGQNEAMVAAMRSLATRLMARGIRDGVIRDDPAVFADLLLSLVRTFLVRKVNALPGSPLGSDVLVDFFLHGAGRRG